MMIRDEWVKLSNGTEVTLYPVMEDSGLCPKRGLTHAEAGDFAAGQGYRLPTEEEEVEAFGKTMDFGLWMWTSTVEQSIVILRGGSWHVGSSYLRASDRYRYQPGFRYDFIGFRCARDIVKTAGPEASMTTLTNFLLQYHQQVTGFALALWFIFFILWFFLSGSRASLFAVTLTLVVLQLEIRLLLLESAVKRLTEWVNEFQLVN